LFRRPQLLREPTAGKESANRKDETAAQNDHKQSSRHHLSLFAPGLARGHNPASAGTPMNILWWHWLVVGLVLVVSELATPGGFYIIFFGIGALAVGVLSAFDLAGPLWTQLLLFSVISVVSITLFRGRMLRTFQPEKQMPSVDVLTAEIAVAAEDIAPGAMGRVELRGTAWSARNDAHVILARGARCRVTRVDGLTLHIVPEGAV
jgi:membrane protein implicated in regulation of membrane protease activity